MIALGLLALDSDLRAKVFGEKNSGKNVKNIRVVGFNGRQSDAPLGVWGAIAEQLGKKDAFNEYYSPLQAPGETAWLNLLKGEPTIIMLDELPPYMEYVKSKEIGNSDLSVVTTTALSNLLVAVNKDGFRTTDCRIQFSDNQFDGETLVRDTLEKVQKFTSDISSDTFRKKCEARLFGGQQRAQWSEIKRRAATLPVWQFHRMDALETLKATAFSQDIWRDEGGIINKGPFPPPSTAVKIQRLSRDSITGEATLKITPVYGDVVYYETGDSEPTTSSMKVGSFNEFKVSELRYKFMCVDSTQKHEKGSSEEWVNTITLRHRVFQQGNERSLKKYVK